MFDQFMDLPLHMLVLHFTIAYVPACALAAIAVCVVPKLRTFPLLAAVAGMNLALLTLTFVTARSGYALQDALTQGNPDAQVPSNDHEEWGERLLWTMVALAAVSVVAAVLAKIHAPPIAVVGATLLVAVVAAVSVGFTIVTGHTGSESHWGYLFGQ